MTAPEQDERTRAVFERDVLSVQRRRVCSRRDDAERAGDLREQQAQARELTRVDAALDAVLTRLGE